MLIEPFEKTKLEAVVQLSLRAWEPVFASMKEAMLPAVFQAFTPLSGYLDFVFD